MTRWGGSLAAPAPICCEGADWLVGNLPDFFGAILPLLDHLVVALIESNGPVLVVRHPGILALHADEHVAQIVLDQENVTRIDLDLVRVQLSASSSIHAGWTVYLAVLASLVSLSGVDPTFYATVSCPIGL
jgi:hypothetical protein